MPAPLAVGLVPGATLGRRARVRFVRVGNKTLKLGQDCPAWAMSALEAGGHTERALADRVLERRGYAGLKTLYRCLAFLRGQQLLGYTVMSGREQLATWIPRGADPQAKTRGVSPGTVVVLSRFAYARRDGDNLVLESPLAFGQLVLHDAKALNLLGLFDRPRAVAGAIDAVEAIGLTRPAAMQCIGLLWRHHFLNESSRARSEPHRDRDGLDAWEFHDLLFHARSRHGRHRNGFGAKPRSAWVGTRDTPLRRPRPADIVPLPHPDLDHLRRNDVPFTAVVEDRRTRRAHDVLAMTIGELGEFLYRTARARRRNDQWQGTDRVSPAGGAAYELETYLAIRRCRGVRPGLYRYDPIGHTLWRRAAMTADVRGLIASAGYAARTSPQIVLIVSARFGRTLRRYGSMGYAMILKDAGVLFQTFYLVATAMGLAPCAIGGGDSDDFARAAGTNYYEETSVGEFLLGRRARSSSVPRGVPRPVHGSQPRRRAR
jgi:SagB-type dehydrogenase family enzyme